MVNERRIFTQRLKLLDHLKQGLSITQRLVWDVADLFEPCRLGVLDVQNNVRSLATAVLAGERIALKNLEAHLFRNGLSLDFPCFFAHLSISCFVLPRSFPFPERGAFFMLRLRPSNISQTTIAGLTPAAREKVCGMIEDYWEDNDEDAS